MEKTIRLPRFFNKITKIFEDYYPATVAHAVVDKSKMKTQAQINDELVNSVSALGRQQEDTSEKYQKLVEDICKLLNEKYPVNYGGFWFYGTNGFEPIVGTKPITPDFGDET